MSNFPSRRNFLKIAGTAGLAVATGSSILAACGDSGSSPATTVDPATLNFGDLRIGYLPITDASPLLVAHANGSLKSEGFTPSSPTLSLIHI